MIVFVGRLGVLDPIGEDRHLVKSVLVERGFDSPSEVLLTLLAEGAGGVFPFTFGSGPAARRSFSEIATTNKMAELRSTLRSDLVVVAVGGGDDLLLVAPSGEVFAELVDQSGTATRSLELVAGSVDELFWRLVLDEGVLDDMVEYAQNDGLPNRPSEVSELRRRWMEAE